MFKQILIVITGVSALISGIVLILLWWPQVINLFKGVIGMILALAGLVILYIVRR